MSYFHVDFPEYQAECSSHGATLNSVRKKAAEDIVKIVTIIESTYCSFIFTSDYFVNNIQYMHSHKPYIFLLDFYPLLICNGFL